MMNEPVLRALDHCEKTGVPARLWLRDDDAVAPTPALDRLLHMARAAAVPVTVAVIPAHSGPALGERLSREAHVRVAVHGWAHVNHAAPGQKSQELGLHRPVAATLAELARGFTHLQSLHGAQFTPVLVPPWNRIAPEVAAGLPALGFRALSVFGPEQPAPVRILNTHVDVMDWRGTRGGRPVPILMEELAAALHRGGPVGVLTHHLVHDAAAWDFMAELFELTARHPGCRWSALPELVGLP